jgi:hypothetical protein
MRCRFPLAALTVAFVLAQPTPAAAGFWAWLSSLSPPGPFTAPYDVLPPVLATVCVQDRRLKPSPIGLDRDAHDDVLRSRDSSGSAKSHWHPVLPCTYVEWATFKSDPEENPDYPEIRVNLVDIGVSARLHDGLDIGGGFGWVWFRHDNDASRTDVTRRKLAITPIRVVVRPLLFVLPETKFSRWAGAFSVYWKDVWISGPIHGGEFGQRVRPGESEFREGSPLATSFGFTVDLTALLPR